MLKKLWRWLFQKKEWQPTVAQMRAALMLRGERIGQRVVSRVGPNGDYSTIASWQEAWNATGGNLVEMRASAVVELCGNIEEPHVFDGLVCNPYYQATVSGDVVTRFGRMQRELAALAVKYADLKYKLYSVVDNAQEIVDILEEDDEE